MLPVSPVKTGMCELQTIVVEAYAFVANNYKEHNNQPARIAVALSLRFRA